MKQNYFLSATAAIVLGLTGFAYAQQSYFNPEIGNVPPPEALAAPATHRQAGTTGKLGIAAPTKLGEATLKAGEYFVRHVDTAEDHFVEFSQVVENDYAPEGQSVYERKVIARVNCTLEPLNAVVARTELQPKTGGTTARLEIRSEKAEHLF